MTLLQDHIARLPAAELNRLRMAARRFEAAASGPVADALLIDAWILRGGVPPLLFAWPVDEVNTEKILHDALVGVRPSEGLIFLPAGWLRIVSRVSELRRRELEAAGALAQAFRAALLRLDEGKP